MVTLPVAVRFPPKFKPAGSAGVVASPVGYAELRFDEFTISSLPDTPSGTLREYSPKELVRVTAVKADVVKRTSTFWTGVVLSSSVTRPVTSGLPPINTSDSEFCPVSMEIRPARLESEGCCAVRETWKSDLPF